MPFDFIGYSLVAACLWGVVGIVEPVSTQISMPASLLIKYIVFSLTGLGLITWQYGGRLRGELVAYSRARPGMLAFYTLVVMCGALGTFYAFRSYSVCGNNKLMAVLIAYCVPVLVMVVLARVWLNEQYNGFAVVGMLMIVGGVLVIKLLGAQA